MCLMELMERYVHIHPSLHTNFKWGKIIEEQREREGERENPQSVSEHVALLLEE